MTSGMIKGTFWNSSKRQAIKLGLSNLSLRFAKEQFNAQKKAARRRKIVWNFPFEDWVGWWKDNLGPNWQTLRGKSKGKFCMARVNDTGPYELGNVKCILAKNNVSEQKVNGTRGDNSKRGSKGIKNGRAKLTENEVREIFKTKGTLKEIGDRFGVSFSVVFQIKKRIHWRHVTDNLPCT